MSKLKFAKKALYMVLSVCFACSASIRVCAQNLDQPQLDHLLTTAGRLCKEYVAVFTDLTAEEVKTFELYDKTGELAKQRRIVSDFVIYQSLQDPRRTAEYRNVREVDGVSVSQREVRIEKVFAQAAKEGSLVKELDRINKEGTRYDFGYMLSGYTIHKGLAMWPEVRSSFRFELAGRERVNNHATFVIKFEQSEPRNDLFRINLPKELKPSQPRLRGRLWIETGTGQLVSEESEIVFNSPYAPEPLVLIRAQYEFAPSEFDIWLPRQLALNYYKPLQVNKEEKRTDMYCSARAVSRYQGFKRFQVSIGEVKTIPPKP